MLTIVQINVGQPAVIGMHQGVATWSAIGKHQVTDSRVLVTPRGIEGDRQADENRHGGLHRAVSVLPVEHHEPWTHELEMPVGPATFGENLSVIGLVEEQVFEGDVFQCGDVLLRATEPRLPCQKLALYLGRQDVVRRFIQNGRGGWYFAVEQGGWLSTSGALQLAERRQPLGRSMAQLLVERARANPQISGYLPYKTDEP